MKTFNVMRSIFPPTLLLALIALTGAACSTTTETTTNTARTSANAPAASPTMTANSNANNMQGMGGMDHSMMQSSPNAASAPYDLQFLDTMSGHHQAAIEMARPAERQAQHAELKELARDIIREQEREISQMKGWREQWYAGKPEATNMEMPGMMDSMKGMDMKRLNAATGNAFDLMFIDMMTPHHQGAVSMAKEALTKAEHPEIKRLAQGIIAAQEKEIAQMSKWKAAWGGANATGAAKTGVGETGALTSHKTGERHDASTGHKSGDFHPPTKKWFNDSTDVGGTQRALTSALPYAGEVRSQTTS